MKRLFLQASAWILCILLATACKNAPQHMNGGSYKTMEVTRGTRTLNQNYTAVINGRQSVEIRPQVSGTITQICIDEGAKVKKGQTLVIIDQVPYEAALQTAVANVKNAEAAVATARLMAESKEELFKEHVVSDFDLQTARNSLFQAEATLAQAKADEINARNNLSYTEVKSPVDGVSGMLPYRVGALVDASISTPLTTVSDDEEMYVYFSMTESQILSLIRANKTLEEALKQMPEVELQLSDGLTYNHKGKIDAISGTIDANTGAVSLRATFPNPKHMLRNGGSGTIIFPYVKENALIVPQEATYEIQDKIFVYKVVDGKATSAQVEVFPVNNGKEYIIEKGLKEGDIIIAEGAGLIQEGTVITPSDSNDQPAQ